MSYEIVLQLHFLLLQLLNLESKPRVLALEAIQLWVLLLLLGAEALHDGAWEQ